MRSRCPYCLLVLSVCLTGVTAQAQSLKVSIGIRENNVSGPIFGNGGSSGGGIEWVNRDGQTLPADGAWHLFTFTPATDPLLAFAGTTANSMLEPGHEFAVIEHIRLLNDQGVTAPLRVWIDDVTNTMASGPVVQNFDAETLGSEVMFQEPSFSGSTTGNLLPGSLTGVSNVMANSGAQSLQLDFQFVDADPTRWIRLTSFDAPVQPNPRVRIREVTGAPATISFLAKMEVVPEPATFALLGAMTLVIGCVRPRRTIERRGTSD